MIATTECGFLRTELSSAPYIPLAGGLERSRPPSYDPPMLSCVPDRAMTGTPIPPDPAAKYYWRIIGGCTGEDPVYSTNGTTVLHQLVMS